MAKINRPARLARPAEPTAGTRPRSMASEAQPALAKHRAPRSRRNDASDWSKVLSAGLHFKGRVRNKIMDEKTPEPPRKHPMLGESPIDDGRPDIETLREKFEMILSSGSRCRACGFLVASPPSADSKDAPR